MEEIVSGHFGNGVDDAVIPELLEYEVGVDNAVIPNLLGDMEWAMRMPWPERGPRLVELPIDVERERNEELELTGSHELKEQDGELF